MLLKSVCIKNMAAKLFLTLPGGQKMPALGLGTWQASDDAELTVALNAALELGYRHLDTAFFYQNERTIGRVLKEWISDGKLKREDLFITTKLPATGVHPDRVELFMKKSLENLQLDYVDLYLIHCPIGFKYDPNSDKLFQVENGKAVLKGKTDHAAIWKKMEEQVEKGRTKHIGLSNYNISQITSVLNSARIKPANLQVEMHVFLQQRQLLDFCNKNGITVVAYCPIANPSYNAFVQQLGGAPRKLPSLFTDQTIAKIAQKYKKTPAQIALRFLLQIGVAPIPKSVNPERLKENIDVFDFVINEGDMKTLSALEIGEAGRLSDFKVVPGIEEHPDYPFK